MRDDLHNLRGGVGRDLVGGGLKHLGTYPDTIPKLGMPRASTKYRGHMDTQPIKIITWVTSSMLSEMMMRDIFGLMESARTPNTHLTWVDADIFPVAHSEEFECGAIVVWSGPAESTEDMLAKAVVATIDTGLED